MKFTAAYSTYLGGPNNFEVGLNSYALFVVFKFNDSGSNGSIFNKSRAGPGAGRIVLLRESGKIVPGLTLQYADSLSGTTYTDTVPANTYRILCFVYNHGTYTTSVYENGTFKTMNVYSSSDASTYQSNPYYMMVGGYNDYGGNYGLPGYYLDGNIAELLCYTNSYDMTTTTRQQIEAYLAWKWGLQTYLPSNHPYYSTSINSPASSYNSSSISLTTANTFSPTSMSSCALWFDAADSTTITKNGSAVSQWLDKSPNGYSVIQPISSNQPNYVANSLNGKGGIQLSSSSWLYQICSNMPNFTSSAATSVFIVARNDTSAASSGWEVINTIFFNNSFTAYGTTRYHFSFANGFTNGVQLYANGGAVGQSTATIGYGANGLLGFTTSSSSTIISVNGTSSSYGGVTLPNANNSSTVFIFGDGRGLYVKDMIIYEMVGFNTQLSTSDQQKVEGYLMWKWGLQSNLPGAHPYYSAAPTG